MDETRKISEDVSKEREILLGKLLLGKFVGDDMDVTYSNKTSRALETFLDFSSCAEYKRHFARNQEKFIKCYWIRGAVDTGQASFYLTQLVLLSN